MLQNFISHALLAPTLGHFGGLDGLGILSSIFHLTTLMKTHSQIDIPLKLVFYEYKFSLENLTPKRA